MNQKYLPIAIIFLSGIMITIIGALFKLMHWPYGNLLLIIGFACKAFSILILIITLIKTSKK